MSLLFTPFSFAGLSLRNRVVLPPMATVFDEGPGGAQADDGLPGDATIEHYRKRSQDGVGLIIVEHSYVSRRGKAHKGQLGIDNDAAIPAFARLARAIKEGGSVAAAQINHIGAGATPSVTGGEPVGPSDVPVPGWQWKPRALSRDEIAEIEELFGAAARRVREAGFDAVEIHAAHGYLHTQFLSPITNNRVDDYGGTPGNRARFLLETVARIKEQVGPCFPVFVRLGSTDGNLPGGFTPDDAAVVARMLQDAGVALIDVSGSFASSIRPAGTPPGYFVEAASTVKRNVAVPVMVTGGITEPVFAEEVLQEGHADLIGIGRAIFRDPDWVSKARKSSGN